MEINWIGVIARFAHLLGAIITVGGAIFIAFVVLPIAWCVPDEARGRFNDELRNRFNKLVMLSIALLLLSGFYNYVVHEMPAHKGQGAYHALMGVKILMAFAVFFLASALMGRAKAFESIRAKRKRWIVVNILLSLAIVVLGAILRAMPDATG